MMPGLIPCGRTCAGVVENCVKPFYAEVLETLVCSGWLLWMAGSVCFHCFVGLGMYTSSVVTRMGAI